MAGNLDSRLFPRDFHLPDVPSGVNKVVTFAGCRRTGKTYLMFQLIDELRVERLMEKLRLARAGG